MNLPLSFTLNKKNKASILSMGIVKVTRRDSIFPSHPYNLALLVTLQSQVSHMPTMDASLLVKVSTHSSMTASSREAMPIISILVLSKISASPGW